MSEREVVLKLGIEEKSDPAKPFREMEAGSARAARSVRDLADTEKRYRLESERSSYKTQRQQAAEEILRTYGAPQEARRGMRPASPQAQQQERRSAAADILELHGASAQSVGRMRGSAQDEMREIDRARQDREEMLGANQKRAADEADYQHALNRTIEGLERAKRVKEDLTKRGYIDRELSEEQKYQKALKQRVKDYETAKRMKQDLAKQGIGTQKEQGLADHLGSRLGVPAGMTKLGAAFGALAGSVAATDKAMKAYYNAFERGEFSGAKLQENLRHWVESNIPIVGTIQRHSDTPSGAESNATDNAVHNWAARNHGWLKPFVQKGSLGLSDWLRVGKTSLTDMLPDKEAAIDPSKQISTAKREYLAFLGQQRVGVAGQRAALESETRRRQLALATESETARAHRESALGLRREQLGITYGAAGARSQAIEKTRGQFGYSRTEKLEDTLRLIGHQEQVYRAGAESEAALRGLTIREAETQRQHRDAQQAYQRSLGAEQPLRQKLASLNERAQVDNRLLELKAGDRERMPGEQATLKQRSAQLHARTEPLVRDELRMRQQLQALEMETEQRRQEANSSEQAALGLKLEKENAIREAQEKQLTLGREYYMTLMQQAQALRQSEKTQREQMALSHPAQLRTALGISRKVKAGQQVTQREIDFMAGHKEWFGTQMEQVVQQRAQMAPQAAMINELMRNAGVGVRRQEIERQALEVKHNLNIAVKTDDAVIQKVSEIVAKAYYDFEARISTQLKNRMDRVENARQAQQKAMFPQY